MENFQTTNIQLLVRNDDLAQQKDTKALEAYVNEVMLPLIFNSLTTAPKGVGGEVHVSCDRGGCSVGGSIKF
jgi:hypothetical protein